MKKINQKKLPQYLRALIQLVFFLLFPSAFTSAFSGVKYLFTQLGISAPITLTKFLIVLLALCGYTILFGRFFCGFACAFGTLGDAVRGVYCFVCKKLHKKPLQNKPFYRYLCGIKYLCLVCILLLCFLGSYAKLTGWNPWEVFSMLYARNFRLGGHILGCILLLGILVGMALIPRFFCRFLCPMGAVFSLLPVLPFFTPKKDSTQCGKNCSACQKCCPSDLTLPEKQSLSVPGDCFQCQKCVTICPKKNATSGRFGLRGNELWITGVKAIGLFLILWFLL